MVSHGNDNDMHTVVLISALSGDDKGLHYVSHYQCESLAINNQAALQGAKVFASYPDDSSRETAHYLHTIFDTDPTRMAPRRLNSVTPFEQMRTLNDAIPKVLVVLPPRGLREILIDRLENLPPAGQLPGTLHGLRFRAPEEGVVAVMRSPGSWRNLSEANLQLESIAFPAGQIVTVPVQHRQSAAGQIGARPSPATVRSPLR